MNFILYKNLLLSFKIIIITVLIISTLFITVQYFYIWKLNDLNQPKNKLKHPIINDRNILEHTSTEQLLVNPISLKRTIYFMNKQTTELDLELIAFVRTLIVSPDPTGILNLSPNGRFRTDQSQKGQSKYIDAMLDSKTGGFFVESGGYDGELHSNTLFLELERNWTGILVEPIPSLFRSILAKNRNIYALNGCIASGKVPEVSKFRLIGSLGVRVSSSFETENERDNETRLFVYVPCFPLNTILDALGVRNVDYFSLNVEGDELSVMSSWDLERIDVRMFTVEYNGNGNKRSAIRKILEKRGYEFLKEDGLDIYFIKN